MKPIRVDRIVLGGGAPLVIIAGPCVIEDEEITNCHTEEEVENEQINFEAELGSQGDLYRAQDFQLHKEVHTGSQEVHASPQNGLNPQNSAPVSTSESVTVAPVTTTERVPHMVLHPITGEWIDINSPEYDDEDEDLELGVTEEAEE